MRVISSTELAKHNKANDAWVLVDGKIFDVTKFLSDHPGGKKVPLALSAMVFELCPLILFASVLCFSTT